MWLSEYRIRTDETDVYNEAMVLSCLCHPYLPYCLGCVQRAPPINLSCNFMELSSDSDTEERNV